METQSRVVGCGLLAWSSCVAVGCPVGRSPCLPAGRFVGRFAGRLVIRPVGRRGASLSSSGHRWPPVCLPMFLASVCDAVGGVLALPRWCRELAVSPRRCWLRRSHSPPPWVLLVPACLAMPYRPPPRFIRQDGRGGAAGVPAVVAVLIGFSSTLARFCFAWSLIRIGGLCLRCGAVMMCGRVGLTSVVCSLAWWRGGAVLPTHALPPTASPYPAVMPFSLFPFPIRPAPLFRVRSCLRASNKSPAPGRGMSERMIGLRLRAGERFACFLSCRVAPSLVLVRYCLACGSGFPLVSRFSCLPGRVLSACVGARPRFSPCSPSRAFSTACFAFRPRLIRRVRSARRPCLLALPRLG